MREESLPQGGQKLRFRYACEKFALRERSRKLPSSGLSDGVTVTQRPLEALFMVRIHVGQPVVDGLRIPPEGDPCASARISLKHSSLASPILQSPPRPSPYFLAE